MALKPHSIFQRLTGPIIAAAIHNGHQTRKSVEKHLALDDRFGYRDDKLMDGRIAGFT